MNYKKLCSLAAIAVTLFGASINQSAAQTTGTTNLNVVITPILSISVTNSDVTLTFDDLSDYQNGVSVTMPGHLTLTSILPYTVSLKANTSTLSGGTGGNTDVLNASAVSVSSDLAGNSTLPGNDLKTIASLSATDAELLSGSYAVAAPADVSYAIPQANVATEILGKTPDTYTVALTYTITNP